MELIKRQPVGAIVQIAYVVEDIVVAMQHWTEILGAGPFLVLENIEFEDPRYRGNQTEIDLTAALCFSGGVCCELIQQNSHVPSVYRELLDRSGPGFHHWAIFSNSFDEDVARYQRDGHALAFSGALSVGRYAYLDTVAELGGMIELIEDTPVVQEFFDNIESMACDWDGTDPVRYAEL